MNFDNPDFIYKTKILEHYIDIFGHVNNASYLVLFEESRWDFIAKGGLGIKTIIKESKGPILVEANIKFKKELYCREEIIIKSFWKKQEHPLILNMSQYMFNSNNEITSELKIKLAFMDLNKRKLISIPKNWTKTLKFSQ